MTVQHQELAKVQENYVGAIVARVMGAIFRRKKWS
jgi:hypothetical protein